MSNVRTARRLAARSFALSLCVGAAAHAQTATPMEIARLRAPLVIDGLLDEEAWREIAPVQTFMYAPTFGGTPRQRTEIRFAYDEDNLYAAGWFYDDDPAGIRINSLYRDRWNGDDVFAIYVDAFNDNQNAKWFGITPAAMRFDVLLSDDGSTQNSNWDTFWSARTRVTDEGWFAEVRIPFSSLGFRVDVDGRAVMGLTATRLVSRSGERVVFPEIDPKFEFRRPSVARDVVLSGVRSRKPLYVTPYALAGRDRTVGAGDDGFPIASDDAGEVGLDVRYPLSGGLTMDVTLNTDFAQVEADDQQVNLDRFPLFFPERRRFFQEGSGIFDFATGSGTRLFHSRRIGLTAAGVPVPVLGGARLVGRVGAWEVGALGMRTDAAAGLPGESFAVVRLRRALLNPYSTGGLIVTSRSGGSDQNFGLGADASIRLFPDHYLSAKWAGTFDEADPGSASLLSRGHLDTSWERRTQRGLAYKLSYERSGPDFRPGLGFLPRSDFSRVALVANRYTFTDDHPTLRRLWPGMLAFSTFRNVDGTLESGQYAVWLQWDTKGGGGGWIEPKLFREDVLVPFSIGGEVEIPAGGYTFADLQLALTMPSGSRLRTSVDARAGTYFDGTRTQLIVAPTWNVSRRLELGGDYQLSLLRFPQRGQSADIQVARLRVGTALDARASGNAFVQYNTTTDRLDFNVRLRYAFAEGTDLWLVYNEGLETERDRDLLGLQSPLSVARSLILKYSHTFAF